jgi:Domain of unknown function (DUF4177)
VGFSLGPSSGHVFSDNPHRLAMPRAGPITIQSGISIMKQYKAVIYQEGMLGSLLLGASKVDPMRFTDFLNQQAAQGWRVVTMEKDMRRMLLLWKREAYVVIMEKDA